MNNDPDISFLDLIKLFSDLAEFEEITESLILILAVGDEFSDYLWCIFVYWSFIKGTGDLSCL